MGLRRRIAVQDSCRARRSDQAREERDQHQRRLPRVRFAARDRSRPGPAPGRDRGGRGRQRPASPGNRSFVPASLPHVLTVGGDRPERPLRVLLQPLERARSPPRPAFQSRWRCLHFFNASGFCKLRRHGFSAPLVAGAAAWVWTDQTRPRPVPSSRTSCATPARDVGPKRAGMPIRASASFRSPAALAAKIPVKRPMRAERRSSTWSRPRAVTASGTRLTTPARLQARLDVTEDPEDVYRVSGPAHNRISASTRSAANVNVALWGPKTRTDLRAGQRANA